VVAAELSRRRDREHPPRSTRKQRAVGRVRALRSLRPEIFALARKRLAWQRGQNALVTFGPPRVERARRVVVIDDERR